MQKGLKLTKKNRREGSDHLAEWDSVLTKSDLNRYISVARDLHYPSEVMIALKHAKSHVQCGNILKDARNALGR